MWWYFDQTPPVDIRIDVMKYIQEHPKEFKGAGPQWPAPADFILAGPQFNRIVTLSFFSCNIIMV